jgi:hypothetical protein
MDQPEWWTWIWNWWTQNSEGVRDLVLTVGAVVGFFLLMWRNWNVHRQAGAALEQSNAALEQAKIAERRHESQVEADRERRITDSVTRAVEQLGSNKLETRLGAIYALERIAKESARDHWPIMETLTAFVRERAPRTEKEGGGPETDVQVALTVIGRRRLEHDTDGQCLDLVRANLRGAILSGGHMEHANFSDAQLQVSQLVEAHLEYERLWDAYLQHALLRGVYLEHADLTGAHMEDANLEVARLKGAILNQAHLDNARLQSADLRDTFMFGVRLSGAELFGADLTGAQGLVQDELNKAWSDRETKLPEGLTIPGGR